MHEPGAHCRGGTREIVDGKGVHRQRPGRIVFSLVDRVVGGAVEDDVWTDVLDTRTHGRFVGHIQLVTIQREQLGSLARKAPRERTAQLADGAGDQITTRTAHRRSHDGEGTPTLPLARKAASATT